MPLVPPVRWRSSSSCTDPLPPPQVIDDSLGHTLASTSTLNPEIRAALGGEVGANVEAAKLVGAKIAELCKQRTIEMVRGC